MGWRELTRPTFTPSSEPSTAEVTSAPGSTCTTDLAKAPWNFDAGAPSYGPGSSMFDAAPPTTPRQGEIPAEYNEKAD